MKKYLLTILTSATLLLAGCSSSGGSSNSDPVNPSLPDLDDSPEWGLDLGDTPDWGITDPDFGIPDVENTPDRMPPIWGGPAMPPIDIGPEAAYTIAGNTITGPDGKTYLITNVHWAGQTMLVVDKEGNEYSVEIIRQGPFEGDFAIFVNGQAYTISGDTIQGGLRPFMESTQPSIDRDAIRDSIRSHLK